MTGNNQVDQQQRFTEGTPEVRNVKRDRRIMLLVLGLTAVCVVAMAVLEGLSPPKEDALDTLLWAKMEEANTWALMLEQSVRTLADSGDETPLTAGVSTLWTLQNALDEIETKSQEQTLYVGAVRAYIANTRVMYEQCLLYIKDGGASNYTAFDRAMGQANRLLANMEEKRAAYLAAAGGRQGGTPEEAALREVPEFTVAAPEPEPEPTAEDYAAAAAAFDGFLDGEISTTLTGGNPNITVKTALSSDTAPEGWADAVADFTQRLEEASGTALALGAASAQAKVLAEDGKILLSGAGNEVRYDWFAILTERESDPANGMMVYISTYGTRYHFDKDCGIGGVEPTTLRDAIAQGLTACQWCVK